MQRVTSKQNPRLREAAALIASARERRKSGRCVLEGEHVVATCAARHGAPETLIVTEAALARPAVRALAERHAERTLIVPESLFAGVASLPAGVGVLAVVATPQPAMSAGADFCLLLDGVQDPGNVGSMLRSAAAAGVAQVLLSKHCAFAWSPKVLRAGQGAHFCLDIHEDVDLPPGRRPMARPARRSSLPSPPREPACSRRRSPAGSRWPSATKAPDSRPSSRRRRRCG